MTREDQIAAAYGEIVRSAEDNDSRLTAAGKVRVEALQAMLNLDPEVTAEERDAAMNAAEKAPKDPGLKAIADLEPVGLSAKTAPAATLSDIDRKAEALGLELDPSWSPEKKAEEVSAAEERARVRAATSARLQRAAESRTLKAKEALRTVKCRVMKAGAGRISAGIHIAGQGDLKYEQGEIDEFPYDVVYGREAVPPTRDNAGRIVSKGVEGFPGYEDRGWVEVLK